MACGGRRGRPREKDVWDVEGGYMGMKKQKLLEQFEEQSKGENKEGGLFKGVSIFVNGWTNPSADELKRLMMTHDGVFHHYYNSRTTTHIIASNLPDVKVRALKGTETIVKPEWITDSIEQGKLLDYSNYLLYTHQTKNQPKISFKPAQSTNREDRASTSSLDSTSTEKSSPSKWLAKDATDSRFLGEFFSNSRLHHIATMGANAKDYVAELRSKHSGTFEARESLGVMHQTVEHIDRTIMHIDMDCFFVSVGLRDKPDLKGKPVVVTHAKGNKASKGLEEDAAAAERRKAELKKYQERLDSRAGVRIDGERNAGNWKLENIDGTSSMSEIASCSYEARAKGIKNGMFLGPALKLCPDLVPIPYDFPGYESVSRILYDTVASYTLDIQAVSCDEMFVDLTSLCRDNLIDPLLFVRKLREEIFLKTGCNCSVGLGPNILLSRLATKKAKPDGEYLVTMEAAQDMLGEMSVTELPGVGRSLERKLAGLGVTKVQQLLGIALQKLQQELGMKTGNLLFNMARGKDDRKLDLEHVRKTVSAEVNYGIRFTTWEEAEHFLDQLSEEVSKRLSRLHLVGRSVTLKLMVRADNAPEETAKFNGHGVCDNISKSAQLNIATSSKDIIKKEVVALVKSSNVNPKDMRGVGITMSKLEQVGLAQTASNNSILKFVQKEFKTSVKERDKINSNSVQNIEEVIDPEFLASLPPDIRAEVEAHANGSKASFKRRDNVLKEKSRNPFSIKKVDKEKQLTGQFSLDPEVLDPDVLNQLPSEIKAEIEERFKVGTSFVKSTEEDTDSNPVSDPIIFSEPKEQLLTELDPEFLDQLPHDIRAEVEKEYKSKGAHQTNSVKTTPVKKADDIIDEDESSCDISFSQVDHTVLAELPAEMQAELRKQYKYSQAKKNRANVQSRTAFDAIMKSSPGKSRQSPIKRGNSKRGRKKGGIKQKQTVKTSSVSKHAQDFDTDLIAEDNNSVDMDVFNALPDFIRAEVETQMKNNAVLSNLKEKASMPTTSKSNMKASTSSSRDLIQDTRTDSEESNSVDMDVFNALPDYIRAEVETQMKNSAVSTTLKGKVSMASTSKSNMDASTSTSRALFQDTETYSGDQTVKELELNKLTPNGVSHQEIEQTGMFCGKSTIGEIRPLLKEWIASSSEPLEDDIEMLSDFFKDLIENWKIDLLQVLLKCLFRNIEKLKSGHLWHEAWKNLVQKVQTVMIQNYGNPLYISDSF